VTRRRASICDRDRDVFMAHLRERNRSAAIAHVMGLIDAGLSTEAVVSGILGPAQREVGRLWEIGDWSVAQEHVATGITDDVLHAVSLRQPDPAAPRGHVVVACMEGEYHAMPARMLTEVLRGASFAVTFLGASLPADSLPSILRETPTIALALSCSLSSHLLQVAIGIDIAHAQGVPVMCGGAAFGSDATRARALGADAWAADASGAIMTMEDWATAVPHPLNVARQVPGDEIDIAALRADLVERAVGEASRSHSRVGGMEQRAAARLGRDVGNVIDHLAVAVRLDDVAVLGDYLAWSVRLDAGASEDTLALAAQVVPRHLLTAHRLLAYVRAAQRSAAA
jgi:methanogenic corrinoid protein MtbC1